MGKIDRVWPNSNFFCRWWGYISRQNFRPFPPCILQEMPRNPNLTHFTMSKWSQKKENQQTVTIILSVKEGVRIHQHAKFQAIPSMCSKVNALKPLWVDGQMNGKKGNKNGHGWWDGPTEPGTGGKKVFHSLDGWTDRWITRKHNASRA